jgi:hypothetical protein
LHGVEQFPIEVVHETMVAREGPESRFVARGSTIR